MSDLEKQPTFNEAVRRLSRRGRIEPEPEAPTVDTPPEPPAAPTRGVQGGPLGKPDDFNTVLRRLRGYPTE